MNITDEQVQRFIEALAEVVKEEWLEKSEAINFDKENN